ncbi:MAG: replication-associated recombination protein A [bacterium]
MEPLASILRPQKLEDFLGQEKLVGKAGPIRKMIEGGRITSMIFWGPPASGKTTLANIIANTIKADFEKISAVIDGKEKLKEIIEIAEKNRENKIVTILFIDEIHRWSKAQQDALLPYVETGVITLIGATTENPSFTVISPLLSRSRVFVFESHTKENIKIALERGVKLLKIKVKDSDIDYLAEISNGDIRFALNTIEIASQISKKITKEELEQAAQKFLRYDKNGEEHYNIISAMHKSLRSSNPSSGVYWVTRMLEAGEDPLYIARRLLRFASEDIGNANPNALLLANQVFQACQNLGIPECNTALIQLAEYLANSPKDNRAYVAANLAKEDIKNYGNLPVPMHLRNAPTKLMKELEYGKGYEYDPDLPNGKSKQQCFPDKLKDRKYFGDK